MLHFKDHIRNIDVGLSGRNKELVKPYLQLFSNFKTEEEKMIYDEIETTFTKLLEIKNEKKTSSLEFALIPVILDLMEIAKTKTVKFSDLWDKLHYYIKGKYNEFKPNEYNTADHGTIYRQTLTNTLQKLGVKTKRHNTYVELIFDYKKIRKTVSQYGFILQEKIEDYNGERGEGSERSIDSLVQNDPILKEKQADNIAEIVLFDNENGSDMDKNDPKDTFGNTNENNKNNPSHTEPSQHTLHSPIERKQDRMSSSMYRIGKTDIWGCNNCKMRDDIWFMQKHPCRGL